MKCGADPTHCDECRKLRSQSDVACMQCLKENGQIRLVLKRGNCDSFVVIAMAVTNVYYKSTDLQTYSDGIAPVIHWKNSSNYLQQWTALKNNLQSLIGGSGNGSDDILKLKQCIIEYESNANIISNDTDSIHNVECYHCCFHCVI